jgi:hypothetical protein
MEFTTKPWHSTTDTLRLTLDDVEAHRGDSGDKGVYLGAIETHP